MIKSFNYTNSKGETKKHIVAVLSETPEYLLGIDLGSVVHKIIEDEKWFDNLYMCPEDKGLELKNIIDLIQHYNLIQHEIETIKDFSLYSKDVDVFYKEDHTPIKDVKNLSEESLECFDLINETETIPNFLKAKNEYNKIVGLFKNRESTKYNDLKESRSAEKKPIEGFDNEWMKSFKNFKKSGIQKEI